ncbi:MAG: YeeE/YedE family protein [Labilithrix sp.]|nr:YeeE/YedE family protein [Labilithrix sp.]MCW5814770.1 YeeE/YedE family protein [Labilithrix sp.]
MHDFTPIPALIGGVLIGLAASILLYTHGKVAGISGIFGSLFLRGQATALRVSFVLGLLASGLLAALAAPGAFADAPARPLGLTVAAGLLVGFGTRLSGGCTSGHGVCGSSRLSARSLAATLTFIASGAATVFVVDHIVLVLLARPS